MNKNFTYCKKLSHLNNFYELLVGIFSTLKFVLEKMFPSNWSNYIFSRYNSMKNKHSFLPAHPIPQICTDYSVFLPLLVGTFPKYTLLSAILFRLNPFFIPIDWCKILFTENLADLLSLLSYLVGNNPSHINNTGD